jgi:hypothetical protein
MSKEDKKLLRYLGVLYLKVYTPIFIFLIALWFWMFWRYL